MATKTELVRMVLGGLIVGLLWVGGCQTGTAPDGEPVPKVETSVPAVDAEHGESEAVVETAPAGAEPQRDAEPLVDLRLRFSPGQTTTYRVTTDNEKGVRWEGDTSLKPASFKSATTGNRVEMTFDQRIVEVDDEGRAVVEVTIKALRYLGRVRDRVALDFDSSSADSAKSPLARLIGQRYRFQMAPNGAVLALLDVEAARAAVQGVKPDHRTALRLLSDDVIRRRHTIPALTALEAEQVRAGQKWSNTRTLSFGMMGAKAYERLYRLAGVEEQDGRDVAVVEMEAIPSAVAAEQLHQAQPVNPFAPMFDSTGKYEGRLALDLDTGAIERYVEKMDVQWIAADTPGTDDGAADPSVVRMTATELYELERVE